VRMLRFISTVTVGDERKVRKRLEVAKRYYFEGSSRKRAEARRALGGQRTGSAVCGGAYPAAPQTGTGAEKKGAGPQQYVEELNGETGYRSRVSELAQKHQEKSGLSRCGSQSQYRRKC
jgi:hypothetical protein